MDEKKTMKPKPQQNISLESRERMNVSGVRDVASFDENTIILNTEMGGLIIKGSGLHINKLNVEDGNLFIEGYIASCSYTDTVENKKSGSFLSNLFK